MKVRIAAVVVFLTVSWQTAWGQSVSVSWDKRPGLALHISGSATGSLWVVGVDRQNEMGFTVHKFNGTNWVRNYNIVPSRRLAVNPLDQLWITDGSGALYFQSGTSPLLMDRKANDVAVGGDGSVWIIGTDQRPGGYGIYKRTDLTWTNINGGAVRIAVEKDGTPWVVNDAGTIFRYNTAQARWEMKSGKARSIHTGAASGAVWMLGAEPMAGGYPIFQWNPATQGWDAYGSYGAVEMTEVAGTPWIVQSDGSIYSKAPNIIISTINITLTPTPTLPPPTPQAQAPVRITGSGKLICAAADSGSATYCGNTKADYVGAYTLDTTCDEGFYDMIYGGSCWKCPDETDGRGGWIRSADAVDKDTACWRVPKETTAHAIKVRSPAWAWDCPGGSFWDIYSPDGIGGSCWRCPDDNPRRTLAAVWASNACASTLNETRPATLLTFNGCPTPNAANMNLPGKRSPGKPFLDIAAGWSQGVASGGCYACPVVDETGNFLITARNADPLYDKESNQGCRINMKWQPPVFYEPGLAYMQGVKDVIWEQRLFDGDEITGFLYDLAEGQELGDATPAARQWVIARWQEIAQKPYNSEAFRSLVFARLKNALKKNVDDRTPGEKKLIESFANYVRDRRIYLAEQGLAMYDAWKAHSDGIRASIRQSPLGEAFYYGTVPLDFNGTLSSLIGMGGVGASVAGTLYAANLFTKGVEVVQTFNRLGEPIGHVGSRSTSIWGMSHGLTMFKSLHGLTVVSGASLIQVAFAILSSIAIDQFVAIESARPKLEASLTEAKQPVDLSLLVKGANGEDMLYFCWAKAMDITDPEDPQVVQLAAEAHARAQQKGYQAPPKQTIEITIEPASVGDRISSGTGAASPFESPGLLQGQQLVSPNGKFQATMQADGNFVIYTEKRPIWATNTQGRENPPYRLAMQPDGNLVVYGSPDKDVTLSGGVCGPKSACIAIWNTGQRSGTAPFTLTMQDDGNLVVYDNSNRAVWASGTNR